jgi:hypothetical protein
MEKRLVLNSWKEIADYMGRGVRTIQRYERDLGLPVHRPAGKSRSAVIAFADEIDQWMRKGPLGALTNGGSTASRVVINAAEWQRLLANSQLLIKRAQALRTQMKELYRLLRETDKRRKLMLSRTPPHQLSKAVAEKTEVLNAKMAELSDLVTREGR